MTAPRDERLSRYVAGLFAREDDALRTIRAEHKTYDLPEINVSPEEGAILHLLVRAVGARRVLEVGTLGGYSGVWLARALPDDGRLVTIEGSEKHAAFARRSFERAGVAGRVELLVGDALDVLAGLAGPFDVAFLDADKAPLPRYFREADRLLRKGGLLLCDNSFMEGAVADPDALGSDVRGMREFNATVAGDRRYVSAVIPVRDGLLAALKVG
jgi:predicted O-methyltransferase YrrM